MPSDSARPHIVHVFPGFGVGGSQVRLAAIVQGLGEQFSHTIVSLNGCFDAAPLLDPRLEVKFAPPLEAVRGPLARLALYRRRLAELKPDLLVTYNWGSMDFVLANIGRPTPHLHVEDGFGPEESKGQFRRRIWTRRLALSRSKVAAPSGTLQQIATRIWKLDARRVHWIPNGIAERDAWSTSLESLDLDLPPGLPIVAWVGALRAEKSPLRLLRAYGPVKDKAALLIVGSGPERASVEAEVERGGYANVRLLGYREDARDIIMQSDILALSSDTEQMPLAVLEAMDAGLAVVSTDVGDVRGMVAPINAPFVTSSEEGLANALSTLVGDQALRRRIGQANRVKCRADYSLGGMVDAWRALLERQIRRAG
jgi:glycosyltransferase involved in cell wall biosynthesis